MSLLPLIVVELAIVSVILWLGANLVLLYQLGRVNDVKYKEPLTNGVVFLVSDDELAVVESSEARFKLVTTKLSDNDDELAVVESSEARFKLVTTKLSDNEVL